MSAPVVAAQSPIAVEVEAGKRYWWCACGKSTTQPFCDGSHKGTQFVPMQWTAPATTTAWFCTCKSTKSAPMCDGTHQALENQSSS